jgi:hypothetical protein
VEPHFTLEELRVAFAWHVVGLIVGADAKVDASESIFVGAHFPQGLLERHGFVDGHGRPTARYADARVEALTRLPAELDMPAKLDLVTTFVGAAVVDEDLERGESRLVIAAARLLGIADAELDAHLDSMHGTVAAIDLPEPDLDGDAS